MPRFVFRDGHWRDPDTNETMELPERDGICAPRVLPDVAEYRSPIDGRPITSRSIERDELKRHGCVIVPPKKREFKNPHFMKKRGIAPDGRPDPGRHR